MSSLAFYNIVFTIFKGLSLWYLFIWLSLFFTLIKSFLQEVIKHLYLLNDIFQKKIFKNNKKDFKKDYIINTYNLYKNVWGDFVRLFD